MSRTEFSPSVRLAAWARCKGHCERCRAKLYPAKFQYDHVKADGLGGKPTLENCAVVCSSCHSSKTHQQDRPIMAKADRQKKAHLGIKRSSRPMAGTKASGWKRKMDGHLSPHGK